MAVELFIAPGTSDQLKNLVQRIPPYDLLKAYRDARMTFNTNDIVLAVSTHDDAEGFTAMPRAAYIDQAFKQWTDKQRKMHPLAGESAHKKLKVPADTPAWWLVVEFPDSGAVTCCAIGAFKHELEAAEN